MPAMQFDGTYGSAKAIATWIGDPAKVNAAPWDANQPDDAAKGGLDLIGVDEHGCPLYTTAYPSNYVVQGPDGGYVVFTAEQYAVAFPA